MGFGLVNEGTPLFNNQAMTMIAMTPVFKQTCEQPGGSVNNFHIGFEGHTVGMWNYAFPHPGSRLRGDRHSSSSYGRLYPTDIIFQNFLNVCESVSGIWTLPRRADVFQICTFKYYVGETNKQWMALLRKVERRNKWVHIKTVINLR